MITLDNFFQREKVSSAKKFVKLVSTFYGYEKAKEFLSSYIYLRNLDNLTDEQEGNETVVQSVLESELEKLQSGKTDDKVVNHLLRTYGQVMANYFASSVRGFLIDNSIMQSNQLLSPKDLSERNKHHYLPGFQIDRKSVV